MAFNREDLTKCLDQSRQEVLSFVRDQHLRSAVSSDYFSVQGCGYLGSFLGFQGDGFHPSSETVNYPQYVFVSCGGCYQAT